MPINPITGEEEGYDVSGYYDEEDAGPFVDTSGSFPVDQPVISSTIAPQPIQISSGPEFRVPVDRPGGLLGAASKEYLSGRPGLFIQGGPTVPSGTIEVNGQLERSQAAPQGLPWWIREADQFKEQRRQEDEALRMAQSMQTATTDATKAMSQARKLKARLQLQADIKAGMPLPEAYARSAHDLYGDSAPRAVAALVAQAKPAKPPHMPTVWTSPEGVKFTQTSPNQFTRDLVPKVPREPTLTPGQQLDALRASAAQADNAGDVKRAKALMQEHDDLLNSYKKQSAPSPKPDATKQETILLNKKTGKRQIFPGKLDPKDVDSARFDMLGYR